MEFYVPYDETTEPTYLPTYLPVSKKKHKIQYKNIYNFRVNRWRQQVTATEGQSSTRHFHERSKSESEKFQEENRKRKCRSPPGHTGCKFVDEKMGQSRSLFL